MEGDQPAFLVLAGGHVVQHLHQDLAEGGAGGHSRSPWRAGFLRSCSFGVTSCPSLGVVLVETVALLTAVIDPFAHNGSGSFILLTGFVGDLEISVGLS